jgi:hypothetical protein
MTTRKNSLAASVPPGKDGDREDPLKQSPMLAILQMPANTQP